MIKAIYFLRKNNNNSLRKKIWENEGVQIENMAEHFVVHGLRHLCRCLLAILVLE